MCVMIPLALSLLSGFKRATTIFSDPLVIIPVTVSPDSVFHVLMTQSSDDSTAKDETLIDNTKIMASTVYGKLEIQ